MKKTLVVLLLAATSALANGGREPYPSDYTPHPCSPEGTCRSVPRSEIIQTAAISKGYSIDVNWLDANYKRMIELTRPVCAKLGTCLATEGNIAIFCNDLLRPEFMSLCDRFPKGSQDSEQCQMFIRVFAMGADIRDKKIWEAGQACAKEKTPRPEPGTMEAWLETQDFGEGYPGWFRVYAYDTKTHVPVMATVSIPDTILRAGSPGGKPFVYYEIKWKPKLVRVPNAAGHTDLVAPKITVTAPHYETVTLDIPIAPGKLIVEMTPPANKLKRGKNTITVNARDAATNKPVELRVLLGDTILGDTNKPLEIEIKKGQKRPEIWARSLFDRYSDVVVAPAEK